MALIVEDGTGRSDADAYVSVEDCTSYCEARGLAFSTYESTLQEAAIRRATQALDAIYGSQFPGLKRNRRNQALAWPRLAAVDGNGYPVAYDAVPVEIIMAVCEAASREVAEPNSMLPDLERGGGIRRMKAGSVEVEYGGNVVPGTVRQSIDGILANLIGQKNIYTARAGRG